MGNYPDCTQLHRGRFQGNSVFAVGRHTEFEKLFKRDQLHEASVYAKDHFLQVESLATGELCDQAVLDLYS